MKTELEKLRDHLLEQSNKLDSGYPKTNTKKFEYWKGYVDAITEIDNYILNQAT